MERAVFFSRYIPNRAYAFNLYEDLSDINDSMELESGQVIAELCSQYHKVELLVAGEVRVVYKDDVYKSISQMPEELVRLFHDEKAWLNKDVYIDNNNWFEVVIYEDNGKWTGYGEVVDCEGMNPEEIETLLKECLKDYLETN